MRDGGIWWECDIASLSDFLLRGMSNQPGRGGSDRAGQFLFDGLESRRIWKRSEEMAQFIPQDERTLPALASL